MADAKSFFDFKITTLTGMPQDLSEFKGKVILAVNTASQCGYTGQYEGLEKLYQQYKAKGLVVIGFPSNDFGSQEPGTNSEIAEFCKIRYGVTFPMSSKVVVKGPAKTDLFQFLTRNEEIKWNFEKFLIDQNGQVAARYPSSVKPDDKSLISTIEKMLGSVP